MDFFDLAAIATVVLFGKEPRKTREFIRDKSTGYFTVEYPKLRANPDEFFWMVRMFPDLFDYLVSLVSPHLAKDALRAVVEPAEMLFITLV